MKVILLIVFFSALFPLDIICQETVPKSWKMIESYYESEGKTIHDTMYLATPESDTLSINVRATITIDTNGGIKNIKILDSEVDFMEDNILNQGTVKYYENKAMDFFQKMSKKNPSLYGPREEEINTVINTSFYVPRKDIFLEKKNKN